MASHNPKAWRSSSLKNEIHKPKSIKKERYLPSLSSPSPPSSQQSDLENYSNWLTNHDRPGHGGKNIAGESKFSKEPTIRNMSLPYITRYLAEKITKIEETQHGVMDENESLKNRLSNYVVQNRQLKEKIASLEKALIEEKYLREQEAQQQRCARMLRLRDVDSQTSILQLQDASCGTDAVEMSDRWVQWIRPLADQEAEGDSEDGVSTVDHFMINKSEFEELMQDMMTLRDEVKAKEEIWNETVDREIKHREHLAQLQTEIYSVRQLSETRLNELVTTKKELQIVKKSLAKFQKEQK